MEFGLEKTLVLSILRHAQDYPWVMQEIGLLGLRLDERREYRLHVWDPGHLEGEPPIHDHPFDFTSTVVAGQVTNTIYTEDGCGAEYSRARYTAWDEADRTIDSVRLSGTSTVVAEGGRYSQRAEELHDSRQLPGTVTIIRMASRRLPVLTVCRPDGAPWVSGRSRPATGDEIKEFTSRALEWF